MSETIQARKLERPVFVSALLTAQILIGSVILTS